MPDTLRADAQHNRDRILQVAHEAFARSGSASLNAIAKEAGVGPGTLYRHFPSREALILAVYQRDVQELSDSVSQVLAAYPDDPVQALRVWFGRLADYVRIKHGLGEALHTAAAQEIVNETYAPVTAAVRELLAAAERAGRVRPGLDPADLLLLMGFLWRVPASPEGEAQAARLLNLVTNALTP